MTDIKAAVIGVGSMGQHHARVYTELPQATLVAVADVSEQQARFVASTYGVRAYTDYRQMLAEERPDAVTVAVPTSLHREVAGAVMESGAQADGGPYRPFRSGYPGPQTSPGRG